ncbi:hypothetical protein JXA56_05535 [Candidatus Micrarchaeota archaeon]|nr:hypothetical protein [Candidatus Micrarchaeota archaeon]
MTGSKSNAFKDLMGVKPEVKPEAPKVTEVVPIRAEVREQVSQSVKEKMLTELFGSAIETFDRKMASSRPDERAQYEKSALKKYLG